MMNIMQLETQMEFLVRILLAGICGGIIGYERKSRNKEAGIRTHLIVASGAALIMIVSKYGFTDILGDKGIALDPSRIAAQIVTGVGFLGAGMIFKRTDDGGRHMGNQCDRNGDWQRPVCTWDSYSSADCICADHPSPESSLAAGVI